MKRSMSLFVLVTACVEQPPPIEPQVTSGVIRKDIPIAISRRADVLFVIDSSAAMIPYADTVRANLGRFVDILRASPHGFPDLRLGVVTADVPADAAQLRTTTGMTGRFITDFVGPDANRVRNYEGDLDDIFARLINVGTGGAAQPLAAVRQAFEHVANAGFLRDSAMTFVFIVSATDEEPSRADDTAAVLRALHADPSKVVVGAIVPDGATSIPALLERFPNRSTRASLADADWAANVFAIFAQHHKTTLASPCIDRPLLDLELLTPGLQPACAVWYEFPVGGEVLPPCADLVGGTCWRIVDDRARCPSPSAGHLVIEQPRIELPDESRLVVECLSRHDD